MRCAWTSACSARYRSGSAAEPARPTASAPPRTPRPPGRRPPPRWRGAPASPARAPPARRAARRPPRRIRSRPRPRPASDLRGEAAESEGEGHPHQERRRTEAGQDRHTSERTGRRLEQMDDSEQRERLDGEEHRQRGADRHRPRGLEAIRPGAPQSGAGEEGHQHRRHRVDRMPEQQPQLLDGRDLRRQIGEPERGEVAPARPTPARVPLPDVPRPRPEAQQERSHRHGLDERGQHRDRDPTRRREATRRRRLAPAPAGSAGARSGAGTAGRRPPAQPRRGIPRRNGPRPPGNGWQLPPPCGSTASSRTLNGGSEALPSTGHSTSSPRSRARARTRASSPALKAADRASTVTVPQLRSTISRSGGGWPSRCNAAATVRTVRTLARGGVESQVVTERTPSGPRWLRKSA